MPKDEKKRQSNSPKDKNTKKDIKSKDDKSGKKKPATSTQASRMMKQKYVRDLKNKAKPKEGDTEQFEEQSTGQVEESGAWAVEELASTGGRVLRQGREQAKKKITAAKAGKDTPPAPADSPADTITETSPYSIAPEAMPKERVTLEPVYPEGPAPKVRSPGERLTGGNVPKERQLLEGKIDLSMEGKAPRPQRTAIPLKERKTIEQEKALLAEKKHPQPQRIANPLKERKSIEQEKTLPTEEKHPQPRRIVNPLKERKTIEQEKALPMEEKRPQPRSDPKPLKERTEYAIKERPPILDLKEPGTAPVPRPVMPPRQNITKAEKEGQTNPLEKSTSAEPDPAVRQTKPAVPPEQRRSLVEKQRSSPYRKQDTPPFSPLDAPTCPGAPLPMRPSMPAPTQLDPPQSAAPTQNTPADKGRKALKERQLFSRKNTADQGKNTPALKTRRTAFKPTDRAGRQRHPEGPQKAARAARRQAQRKMLDRPKRAVKGATEALKKVAQVITKSVSAATSAASVVIGGAILLIALVVVIIIAAVVNSPFGLFYAQEPNAPDTVSVAQAVASVNIAYNAKLEELQSADSYDSIDIQGSAPDWPEVLAVFAVKLAGVDIDGLDVATLDPDRVSKLTAVFWDMTTITSTVETIDHPASGDDEAWTEKILHITITPKTADDMRTIYNFTEYQNSALDELLSDRPTLNSLAGSLAITGVDERRVLAALPDDLDEARRKAVENALSLVGKVNYFWGGKSRAIGWDSRWGTLQKVTAAGSPSTGTYRPFGLDCSGMIDWALRNAGLPSDGNWYIGVNLTGISNSEARPGDMALFSDASHIGIIVGRNEDGKLLVCHCSSGKNNVVVTEFSATGFTVIGRPSIYA